MIDLCFYILLYMSILDGYRDFNRKKYINSEKSAIVYGDIVKAGAGKGWMRAKPYGVISAPIFMALFL